MIVCGDIHSGMYLMKIEPIRRVLSFVSKDISRRQSFISDFIIDSKTSAQSQTIHADALLVSTDYAGNLAVLSYNPAHSLSNGGKKLVIVSKMHAGSALRSMKFAIVRNTGNSAARVANLLFDADGSVRNIVLVEELVYKRLLMLQVFD